MTHYLTDNFTMAELTRSAAAVRAGLVNVPSAREQANLLALCREVLQPLRDRWGAPIVVGSGYRCHELNALVGGVRYSDHIFGCAADIHALSDLRDDNRRLFDLAVTMMERGELHNVKQIIDEYGYNWIHISRQDGRSTKRNQVLHIGH